LCQQRGPSFSRPDTPRTSVDGEPLRRTGRLVDRHTRAGDDLDAAPRMGNCSRWSTVHAGDSDAALKAGWAAYRPDAARPLKLTRTTPSREGWTQGHVYIYLTSPNERARGRGRRAQTPAAIAGSS